MIVVICCDEQLVVSDHSDLWREISVALVSLSVCVPGVALCLSRTVFYYCAIIY